jgi:hypothetical protein
VPEPDEYSYSRYLAAKKTVDDRALNRRVNDAFVDALAERSSSPIRVLEVGGGIGATAERVIGALEDTGVEALNYTLLDVEPENVDAARERLPEWGREQGYDVWGSGGRIVLTGKTTDVSIRLVTGDLFDLPDLLPGAEDGDEQDATDERKPFDAVVAQAVLDILDLDAAFDVLDPLLADGGLWYLPIHFDGVTAFEPTVDAGMDAWVERLYHESMTEGRPGDLQDEEGGRGGPHTGRRLLTTLRRAGTTLLEAGSSDWVVFAREDGYPGDEAYFLHHVLHFIETELTDHPDLDTDSFASWIETRRRQIDDETLVYVAHQLDVLARK